MTFQEIELLKRLAQSWNNLDIGFIEHELADDIIYESQWVLVPIKGKLAFLIYLNSKFTAIKKAMQSDTMIVTAEIAVHPSMNNQPCIVLKQISSNEITQASILVKIKDHKITRIDTCFIPDPLKAHLTGEIPK